MDELQFEYERDPLTKEQAAASIKKTEWLEYLDYRKYAVIVTAFSAVIMTGVWVLERLCDLSPANGIGATASVVALLMIFPAYFVVLSKLRRRYSLVMNRQYGIRQETRSSRITKFAPVGVVVLIFILMRSLLPYLMIIGWSIGIAIQWWGLHKLKKNLRDWDILESEARS